MTCEREMSLADDEKQLERVMTECQLAECSREWMLPQETSAAQRSDGRSSVSSVQFTSFEFIWLVLDPQKAKESRSRDERKMPECPNV